LQRMSLIEASKNRWGGANTQVYARGMLVAFLCDLALLETSKGKISTDDLVRDFPEPRFNALDAPIADVDPWISAEMLHLLPTFPAGRAFQEVRSSVLK